MPSRSVREIIGTLRLGLSQAELESSYDVEQVLYGPSANLKDKAYKLRIAEVFASPLYSDVCKKYCAASNINNELMLSVADPFLTEEIILTYIENGWSGEMEVSYFKAIMSSSHLSTRILEAVFSKVSEPAQELSLELIPDSMVTPEVIKSWRASARWNWGWDTEQALSLITARVRKAHPEYQDLPDEWMMKMFYGE